MTLSKLFTKPLPHIMTIDGPVGILELMLQAPIVDDGKAIAVICHPNTSQQGTMHNKVVTTLAKALGQLNMPTVRFNFRAAGGSEGEYDHGVGEQDDLFAVLKWLEDVAPGRRLILAGFSFGSYVSAAVANECNPSALISIAPAVDRLDYTLFNKIDCPWFVLYGDQDEVVAVESIRWFVNNPPVALQATEIPGATHFFHGQLIDLKDRVFHLLAPRD